MTDTRRLQYVYEGWEGYNRSLAHAAADLTSPQLAFRGSADMRSVGELFWHIANGRVHWLSRIDSAGFAELVSALEEPTSFTSDRIVDWLNRTWTQVSSMLDRWSVEDLSVTYEQHYQGKVYAVSRQWVIWRIMAHDIHHGGQLSELLAMQGIFPAELTMLGGHLTEPPVVGESPVSEF